MAQEAFGDAEMATFKCGVLETETRLVEEMAGVCRDYCIEAWAESLNRVRVPVDYELRSAKNICIPEDIQEVPEMLPPPVTDPLPSLEQLSIIQAPSPGVEISIGDGKGKEVQPLTKAN